MRFSTALFALFVAGCAPAPAPAPRYTGPPGAYGSAPSSEGWEEPGSEPEDPGFEPGDGEPEDREPGPVARDGVVDPGPDVDPGAVLDPSDSRYGRRDSRSEQRFEQGWGPDSSDPLLDPNDPRLDPSDPLLDPNEQGPDPSDPAPAASLGSSKTGSAGMRAFEAGVVGAINRLRRDPAARVASLRRHRAHYRGRHLHLPGVDAPILTFEGVAAVDEAIDAARRAPRLPELRLSAGLSRAARAHAAEIGRLGTVDHDGRDGSEPLQRMERHGRVSGLSGENIGTGWGGAEVMVLSLFIDDGVSGRGHRVNLLERDYRVIGVGCAPHRRFGTVCVLDMAAGFRE